MGKIEEIKNTLSLEAVCEEVLERARRGQKYVCPYCGSGGHGGSSSDSAFSIRNNDRAHCYACGEFFDAIDVVAIGKYGLDKSSPGYASESVRVAAEYAGLTQESPSLGAHRPQGEKVQRVQAAKPVEEVAPPTAEEMERYKAEEMAFEAQARDALTEGSPGAKYLEARGFSLDTACAWQVGYDPVHREIVAPCFDGLWHFARAIDDQASFPKTNRHAGMRKPPEKLRRVLPELPNLGNVHEGRSPEFAVITEGVFDAMRVHEAGYVAIPLLGEMGAGAITAKLEARGWTGTALILTDSDDHGRALADGIARDMEAAGIAYEVMPQVAGHKDPAETPAEELRQLLDGVASSVRARDADRYGAALRRANVVDSIEFARDVLSLEGLANPEPTGFTELDACLNGGLFDGFLYVLGAVSSLGKTTLAVQMADHIAANGRPVLFVTVEQGGRELVSKSLSRLMAQAGSPVPAMSLCHLRRRMEFGPTDNAALNQAFDRYAETIAPWLLYMQADTTVPDVATIRAAAEAVAERCDRAPVVFIDYLQLLAKPAEHMDEREAIDANVRDLRIMAREVGATVVAITSLNRACYYEPVSFSSSKGSGSIEYSADVLLGLQYGGLEEAEGNRLEAQKVIESAKGSDAVPVELKVLKNRNGNTTGRSPISLTFRAKESRFEESCGALADQLKADEARDQLEAAEELRLDTAKVAEAIERIASTGDLATGSTISAVSGLKPRRVTQVLNKSALFVVDDPKRRTWAKRGSQQHIELG